MFRNTEYQSGRFYDTITLSQSFAGFLFSNQAADSLLILRDCDKRALEKQGVGILIRGTMKTIELTQGKVTTVDDDMYSYLMQWKWYARKGTNTFYAERNSGGIFSRRCFSIHRVVMDAPDNMLVDHIDGNGLNNCRSNLRVCTHSENMKNSQKHSNNTSGYKGVAWDEENKKWRAHIMVNRKHIQLGRFSTPEEAARVYDVAAKLYHGKFAKTNF